MNRNSCWSPVFLIAIGLISCRGESSNHSNTAPFQSMSAAPPGSPAHEEPDTLGEQTVILTMGWQEVSYGQIRRAFTRRLLLVEQPLDELAQVSIPDDPLQLWRLGETVLQDRRLLQEGARLGLLPDEEEISRVWREHPQLGRFVDRAGEELERQLSETLALSVRDIRHLILTDIVYQRWLDATVARIPEEELLDEYLARNDTVCLDVVEIPNLPSSDEIENFLASPFRPNWVEDWYQSHIQRYTLPESADVRIVRVLVPQNADDSVVESARSRIEAWRRAVQTGVDMVWLSQTLSEDPARDSEGLMFGVVRTQFAPAFEVPLGVIGPVVRDRHGFHFFRVEALYPSRPRPLDHPLQREIAADFLNREVGLPAPRSLAERVLASMRGESGENLEELVRENHLVRQRVDSIRFDEEGMIPQVGVSPPLQSAIFRLTADEPVLDRPYLVEGSYFAARLIRHNQPSIEDFELHRAEFARQYTALVRATAWDAYWDRCRAEQPIIVQWPPGSTLPPKIP